MTWSVVVRKEVEEDVVEDDAAIKNDDGRESEWGLR